MKKNNLRKKIYWGLLTLSLVGSLAACASEPKETTQSSSTLSSVPQATTTTSSQSTTNSSSAVPTTTTTSTDLANLTYDGVQTVDINGGVPTFSPADLSLANGAWEKYGDLDTLNRATSAEAMLNQSLMPKDGEERGSISSVTPTGWKNKKISGGYLYNRSHLIGWALADENANWQNLITGTRQLNSPEMLRFEMDVKTYLEASTDHYVRYSVTPIFRGDELLARGVHMQAQSIGDNEISFNVFIHNVQDGVTLNYADGSSSLTGETMSSSSASTTSSSAPANTPTPTTAPNATADEKEYVDAKGNGLIKGSKNKIYHLPGSKYYDQTTNPKAWFKTIAEAKAAGYRAPK